MNKDEITKAVDTLSSAVKAEQEAQATLDEVEARYNSAFAKWVSENSELSSEYEQTTDDLRDAKDVKSAATKAVRKIAPLYFEANPEARTETPGLSYRLERKPVLDDDFAAVAVKAGATFLLKPDDKAIKNFVQGMATQNKDTKRWTLPESVLDWLDDSLQVKNDYVTTIVEDKLEMKVEADPSE